MKNGKRSALITGAGRNIGRACAVELARQGFDVVVNGSSDRDACERVAEEVRSAGAKAIVAIADIGDKSAVETMIDAVLSSFGSIDVLVNNAAIRPATTFLDMSDRDLERVMNVNAYSAVWLSTAFLPGMVENGWGRLINFAGRNSLEGTVGRPHVAMSKHASWGLIKSLSREFGPQGITANLISPGTFPDQDMDISQSVAMQEILKKVPVARLGEHQDIAAMVGLLCSDYGGFINGQLLQINGGVVG